ncbi:LuxR C-terminal-related transcriptional regulator [Pseudomonas sp. Marseille-P9899]|uniref:LuxR C-terminal-related transcriptional regulator n=1 Tax=Pseudomonas sp. Marseille-P9899 TaxID=2730401 RepID=UPI00158BBAA6|nr:LuxR C-terminal-related transcriptional regulator [Pseudomonas sp. Marseille-P9899]
MQAVAIHHPEATRQAIQKPGPGQAVTFRRVHLLERFNQQPLRALTLVHAPMGFGKTTLLRQFFEERSAHRACAWLTLSERDNDIGHFLQRLERAFALEPASGGNLFERMEHLLLGAPICLFLDEFEAISNEGILSLMRELLKRIGPESEVIIGSRTLPSIGVPRLRAQGAILEITAHQLNFTHEETQRLFQQRPGHHLSDAQITLLHRKSEGWPAFLGLFCATVQGPLSDAELLQRFGDGRASMTEMVSLRVLATLAEPVREFLLASCALDEFDADTCDHVLQRQDSEAMIAWLEKHQLFIVRVDPQHKTWRYHSVFATVLKAAAGAGQHRDIQRRAADWYQRRGRPILAINHYLQAGCSDAAVRLLEALSPELLVQGRARLLLRWLDQLPGEHFGNHPRLTLTMAWALGLNRRHDEALRYLANLRDFPDLPAELSRQMPTVRAVSLSMADRTHESLDLAQIDSDPAEGELDFHQLVLMHIVIYALIARNDFAIARRHLARMSSPQVRQSSFNQALTITGSGSLDLIQARLSTALSQLGGERPNHSPYLQRASLSDVTLAIALYERDETARCLQVLTRVMPLIAENGTPDQLIQAHLLVSRIHAINGAPQLANEYLDELDSLGSIHAIPRLSSAAWLGRAWLAWRQGDLTGASYACRRSTVQLGQQQSGVLVACVYDADWAPMMSLRLAAHGTPAAQTIEHLRQAVDAAEAVGRVRRAMELKMLLARAMVGSGDEAGALRVLEAPLRHAISEGYYRVFLDEGEQLCHLASQWCERNRATLRGQDSLLERFIARLAPLVNSAAEMAKAQISLSQREFEVLALLETGMRNNDMADRLFVSETTVRTHLRSISAKLGARSRTEAVSLARQMQLI